VSKPSEDDLRRAKENLQRVVSDQQRVLGVPDPGGRKVDEFIAPILEKVARGGSERESPAPVEHEPDPDISVTELGTYEWDLQTNKFAALPGSYLPSPEDRIRTFIRFLLMQPDTNALFLKIGRMCSKHTTLKPRCTKCERREEKFRQVVRQCAVKYGYGKHAPAPKVFSIGAGK